jgi:two-component system, NarL family, sensor histidine kinase FusK
MAVRSSPVATDPALGRLRLPSVSVGGIFRYGAGVCALVGLYYGSAQLGYTLDFTGPVAAIVWLPVGVGISFLYLGGMAYWPGLLIGDLLANDYSTLPVGSAMGQSFGNVLEVVVAVLLLRRLLPDRRALGSVGGLPRMLVSIAAGTAVSATVGLASLRLGNVVTTDALPKLWRTWWLGDSCGGLLVVPLALAWSVPEWRARVHGRLLEGTFVVVAILGLSELAFHTSQPIVYIVFPVLIWAGLRFGMCGATLAVAIAGGAAVWGTTHYEGPFTYGSVTTNVLEVQLYILVASLSTLLLAAVVSERQGFAEGLRLSRARLAETAEIERRRIEHDLHDGAQQRLTALAVFLEIAAEQAGREPGRAPALFGRAERDLLLAIDELRELAHGIQPPMLTKYGLASAIRRVAQRSSMPVTFSHLTRRRFDSAAESAAYFVLVEAINNAQKHSRADSVRVSVEWRRGMLELEVADDGVGGAKDDGGFGLQGLHDRVEAVGGSLVIASAAGEGTRIAASIPAIAVSK